MAESEKKGSSSSETKEKSMFDDDIGKDFFSSWKSMSVTEADTMDFGFDEIPTGKKNAFNFGKLDHMDFSLDNDFGKFNVDMPDLDFSNPTKKVAKPKDQREGESSSKNYKEKDGPFKFSFDFNDMDDFNLDSTLTEQENAPKSNLDRKNVASDKSELRDSSVDLDVDGASFDEVQNKQASTSGSTLNSDNSELKDSSIDLAIDGGVAHFDEGINKKVLASGSALKSDKSQLRDSSIDIDERVAAVDERQNKNVSASGNALKSDVETTSGCSENREVLVEKSPSNTVGSHTTSSSTDRTSPVNVDKEDQQVLFSTKTSPAVSSAKETSQISLGKSLGEIDSPNDNVVKVQMEVDSLGSKLNPESVPQHSGLNEMVTAVGSDGEISELKDSDSPNVTKEEFRKAESDTASKIPKENCLETESVAQGSEIKDIPAAALSPFISKERDNDAEDCTAKVLAAPESEQVLEKMNLIKERERGVVYSKFFKRSDAPEPQVYQPLAVNEKASILETQGTAVLTLNSLRNGKCKDMSEGESQIARNITGDSKSLSSDSNKGGSALVGRKENVNNPSNIRVGLTETGSASASKLPDKPRLLGKELNKVTSVMLGSTKLKKGLNNISGDDPTISTDRTTKPSCQTSENSKSLVPIAGSKFLSVGESTVKKADLSSFKLPRTSVSSKAQTDASQEFNSLKNSQKSVEQRSMEMPANLVASKAQADASQEYGSLKNAQRSVEHPVSFASRKAQADASQESCSLKNAQRSVEHSVKLASRKAQADASLELSSLKNAQRSVEHSVKSVPSKAQTETSQEFCSLMNSQKIVELPSSKDQKDASREFSSLKNSRKSVELPVKFISSKGQTDTSREFSSLENSQKTVELQIKPASPASTHPVSKMRSNFLGITSLKRKTLEGSPGEAVPLNPHKRLSQSPRESRYSTEPIKSAVDEQPYGRYNLEQNNTNIVKGDGTTSGREMAMDVNVNESEISLTMENGGIAEKAEAYAKELENICNMLKKKHEEAKEIMVRAIVTNNSLLMLNHPIFDERIRNAQKLLTKLAVSH